MPAAPTIHKVGAYTLAWEENTLPLLGTEPQSSSPLTTEPSVSINNLFNEVITRIMGLPIRSLRAGAPISESAAARCKTVEQNADIQKAKATSGTYTNELPVARR
jgi:hypothetical protein